MNYRNSSLLKINTFLFLLFFFFYLSNIAYSQDEVGGDYYDTEVENEGIDWSQVRFPSIELGIQPAVIKRNGENLNSIPNFSWGVMIYPNPLPISRDILYFQSGFGIKNNGINVDLDTVRVKSKTYSFVGETGGIFILNKKNRRESYLSMMIGCDYNFHYKEKILPNFNRKRKRKVVSEFNSNVINSLSPFARIGFGVENGSHFFVAYYFDSFFKDIDMSNSTISGDVILATRLRVGITRFLITD